LTLSIARERLRSVNMVLYCKIIPGDAVAGGAGPSCCLTSLSCTQQQQHTSAQGQLQGRSVAQLRRMPFCSGVWEALSCSSTKALLRSSIQASTPCSLLSCLNSSPLKSAQTPPAQHGQHAQSTVVGTPTTTEWVQHIQSAAAHATAEVSDLPP
jgi:hypothetical protein